MKKLMIVMATLATVASFATSPCSGGDFGGRRATQHCVDETDDCSTTHLLYWEQASCDWWCCPTGVYMVNNCGTFAPTGQCCDPSDTGLYHMVSPNPLSCAP